MQRIWLWIVLGVWALCVLGSVTAATLILDQGSGFTRGVNRILAVIALQTGALAMAVPAWRLGRGATGVLRALSRLPAVWAGLVILAVAGLTIYGMTATGPVPTSGPGPAPKPVTP